MKTSAVPNFDEFSSKRRIETIGEFCGLTYNERNMLGSIRPQDLGNLGENQTGSFPYALRFANYFKINGRDCFMPYVIEEASVVAAACYGAKLCYDSGGIKASVVDSKEFSKSLS